MPVKVVSLPGWSNHAWLVHGFSTRLGGKTTVYRETGDLNLGFTPADSRVNVAANRDLFMATVADAKPILGLVTLRQVHSPIIHRVGSSDMQTNDRSALLEGDGFITDEPGVLLGIQTADCIPVLVVDLKRRAVAAFHAGWRGTFARIVESGISRMQAEVGSDPKDLVASIGPGIGRCCYSVGEEVRKDFESQFNYAGELFHSAYRGASHLDLLEANRRQLLAAGLDEQAVTMTGQCTGCRTDLFFSHRIEQGFTGRMMSVIGVAAK